MTKTMTNDHQHVRTRIAPSPTGYPHIGTVYQALINLVIAHKHNGKFIIRIEDTDQKRQVDKAEEVIYQALEHFRLAPDEGPKYGGEFGPYRQSERLDLYQKYAQQLVDQGDAYYCFCRPEELEAHRKAMQKKGLPPMYSKKCRSLDPKAAQTKAKDQSHVIRMKIPSNTNIIVHDELRGEITFDSNVVDDQVILKSDGFPTYHLAVVVDDQLMQISHMVRGEEWISSSPKHVLLYQYFNWPIPKFIHLPLLRNPDRSKISKRHGHTSAQWYIDQGYLVEAVINFLASRVWNHPQGLEVYSLDDIIKHFDYKDMHIQGPIVDLHKLDWLNGQWVRRLSRSTLIDRAKPFLPQGLSPELFKRLLPLIKERIIKLSDIPDLTAYFIKAPPISPPAILRQSKLPADQTAAYLTQVSHAISSLKDYSAPHLETRLRQLQVDLGLKPRPAFMTIRYCLTGQEATPPLFDVMEVLGRQEVNRRLGTCIQDLAD